MTSIQAKWLIYNIRLCVTLAYDQAQIKRATFSFLGPIEKKIMKNNTKRLCLAIFKSDALLGGYLCKVFIWRLRLSSRVNAFLHSGTGQTWLGALCCFDSRWRARSCLLPV